MPAPKLLIGLIGAGIQRSLTPAMQEAEAAAQGLRMHYQIIDLDSSGAHPRVLPELVAAARIMGFAGLNITYPCKQLVVPLLQECAEDARAMGAVNTVVFAGGRAIGHNTDGSGWRWGFERSLPDADLSRVVLVGAGGAGAAIAHTLCRMGADSLVVVDREPMRAAALASALAQHYAGTRVSFGNEAEEALDGASGLVHATPTGMAGFPGSAVEPRLLRPGLWVSEAVYVPLETPLLAAARAAGCRVMDGGAMAVGQAIGAFELFTGRKAVPARVAASFRRLLAERQT